MIFLSNSFILLKYMSFLPIYLLSQLMPKERDLWVFGAWFGTKYADNCKYLFEYVEENHPEVKAVWLTHSKDIVGTMANKGSTCYLLWSFQGIMAAMRARVVIFSHAVTGDFIPATISSRSLRVQLWHGIALKKIVFDDKLHQMRGRGIKKVFFPFMIDTYDLVVASSTEVKKTYASAFRINPELIEITGFPRNDILAKKLVEKNRKAFSCLYMPTFRGGRGDKIDLFYRFGFDMKVLDDLFQKENIAMDIKLHPVNIPDERWLLDIGAAASIKLINDDDIYASMHKYDLLITDYSSVFFDFLLLDRPMIFAPFDFDSYLTVDRELYYEYDSITPGAKVYEWNQLAERIIEEKNGNDVFAVKRQEILNMFHEHLDDNSSLRVCEAILRRLKR